MGSYLLQGPEGVHHRPDLLLSIETQEFVHHRPHQAAFPVPEKEVEEREPCYDFVLFVEFNGVHLLHLPPLEREGSIIQRYKHGHLPFATKCLFLSHVHDRLHLWLTDFAKLKKLFVSPVTMFDAPEKTEIKGWLGAVGWEEGVIGQ